MPKAIGPSFGAELAAGGLTGLAISWTPEGTILRGAGVSDQQWADVQAVYTAHDPELSALRSAKRSAIDAAYAARISAGAAWSGQGGHVFQIDAESRGNIASRATRAGLFLGQVAGVTWPEGGLPFRTIANVWLMLTAAEFIALAQSVDDTFTGIRQRYAELKDACDAAADAAAISAINPATGWPA